MVAHNRVTTILILFSKSIINLLSDVTKIYEYKNLNQQYVFVIELVQLFLLFWATILHLWVQLQTNTG